MYHRDVRETARTDLAEAVVKLDDKFDCLGNVLSYVRGEVEKLDSRVSAIESAIASARVSGRREIAPSAEPSGPITISVVQPQDNIPNLADYLNSVNTDSRFRFTIKRDVSKADLSVPVILVRMCHGTRYWDCFPRELLAQTTSPSIKRILVPVTNTTIESITGKNVERTRDDIGTSLMVTPLWFTTKSTVEYNIPGNSIGTSAIITEVGRLLRQIETES